MKTKKQIDQLQSQVDTLTITREKLLGELCIAEESLKDYEAHYNRQCEELDKLKVEQERLEEVNKELQYQLGCVTGREREHKANSDFWCKRCEDLQQKIDQLQLQVNTPTVAKEKLLIDKDTIEESLKIAIDENNRLKHELSVYGATGICETCTDKTLLENDKLKQTLRDIKPILEVYSDTKLGVKQQNGTYSLEIKDDKVIGGKYFITYNPNLAKTALDKINEVI